ncbi:MAG TPA: hypothetical protein VEL76_14135 [Gemmataceae bacterium]|nr:hypothetical protein [Gemmataceae bacterium]
MTNPEERIAAQLTPSPPLPEAPAPAGLVPPDWNKASRGLGWTHVGLQLGFFGALAIVLGTLVLLFQQHASGPPREPSLLATLLVWGGLLTILPAGLVVLVGEAQLCMGPTDCGVRGWAIATFILGLLGKLLALLAAGALFVALQQPHGPQLHDFGPPEPMPPPFALWFIWQLAIAAAAVANLGETVLLTLTLRALALAADNPKLAQRALAFARFFVPFVLVLAALHFLSGPLLQLLPEHPHTPDTKTQVASVLLIGELVCLLVLMAQFVRLVSDTRDGVASARDRAPTTVC